MDITMGLWLDPVSHEGDWDGTRPWPPYHKHLDHEPVGVREGYLLKKRTNMCFI